jgi:protein-L-isoaspartate(D-aspartate) O-methyltransferase
VHASPTTPERDERTLAARRAALVESWAPDRTLRDPRVLQAMRTVPRHLFVEPSLLDAAYQDVPLPIAAGQAISQPYVVAWMTQALELKGGERVLEVGTGSGYAAAVLGLVAREVHTIERLPELAGPAADRLRRLGFGNVHTHVGDGTLGWPAAAPYDGIAVAAGGPDLPQPLLEQLSEHGRLVMPVGVEPAQDLVRVTRQGDRFERERLGPVRFVPLIGAAGWRPQGPSKIS